MSNLSNPLRAAQTALGKAAEHVRAFHARRTVPGVHTYVEAGHQAIKAIDQAIDALYQARGILVGEIRDDQDQRAARTDMMLHQWRESRVPGDDPEILHARAESEDPETRHRAADIRRSTADFDEPTQAAGSTGGGVR